MTALELAGAVVVVGAALGTLGGAWRYVVRPMLRIFRKVETFTDAWTGEPARDGLPARPGVIERLVWIEAELRPNGGGSARDSLDRIEGKVAAVERKVDDAASVAAQAKDMVATVADVAMQKDAAAQRDRAAIAHRLDDVEAGLMREPTYLALVNELGVEAEPVKPVNPSEDNEGGRS